MTSSGNLTAGARFRKALAEESPLQVMGTINAYCAIMAQKTGYRAGYISGAGVANAAFGLPDLGITSLDNVLEEVRRLTDASTLPFLVDIDTGWGGAFNIARTIRQMIKAGAAAVHIEDQIQAKRCGHRPNKSIVPTAEMVDRLKAAVDARTDEHFVIMARTDAIFSEGLQSGIERAQAYIAAGADMIFAEAVTSLADYHIFCQAVNVPVLANMTEFGRTPLLTLAELKTAGVAMVLYPLSAFRAMNAAALTLYETIRKEGTQQALLNQMQTREGLYDFLDYYAFEKKLDELYTPNEDAQSS